jgi:glycosyltransferase 2 family protein
MLVVGLDMDQQNENNPESQDSLKARWLKAILGNLLAAACLAWAIYHVHPQQLWHGVRQLEWPVVLAAIALDQFSFVLQGVRWRFLLQPVAPVRLACTVQAIYVGLFTNDVLPMRIGELIRAHLVSRWYSANLSAIIPSMVLERLFEGVWLALGIGFATMLLPLPGYVLHAAQLFGGLIIAFMLGFLYVVFRKEKELETGHPHPHDRRHRRFRLGIFIEQVAEGLREIGISTVFGLALAVTLGALGLQALAMWLIIDAYDLPIAVWQGIIVFLVLRVGIVIPGAPANIGTYQFFTALGLELFGVNRSVATGFSFVVFFVLSGPTWIIGFFALSRSGMTLLTLLHEAKNVVFGKPLDP